MMSKEKPETTETVKNYYEILGVSQDATLNQIENSYQKLALKWHPDKHTTDRRLAERKFQQISEAFDVLSDPSRRSTYNQMISKQSSLENAYRVFDKFFGETQMMNEEQEKFFEKHFPDKKRNYYKILGVNKDASMQQITDAYRKLALKYHPKSNPNNEQAQRKFVEINEAYQTLSNRANRSTYDDLMFRDVLPRRAFDVFEDFFEDRWMDMPSEAEFFKPIFGRRRPMRQLGSIRPFESMGRNGTRSLMGPEMGMGMMQPLGLGKDLSNIKEGESFYKEQRFEKKNGKENHTAQTVKRKINNGIVEEETLKENWLPTGQKDVIRTVKKGEKVDTKTYHLKPNENLPKELTNF